MFCNYFHEAYDLSFNSCNSIFCRAGIHSQEIQFISFSFDASSVLPKNFLPGLKLQKFSILSSRNLIILDFTLNSMICFNFCIKYEVCIKVHFFLPYPIGLTSFDENTTLYPLNCLCTYSTDLFVYHLTNVTLL